VVAPQHLPAGRSRSRSRSSILSTIALRSACCSTVTATINTLPDLLLTQVITRLEQLALKVFGYKKGELEGKNVSILMPNPFSQRHNSYLRNYVTTGKPLLCGMRAMMQHGNGPFITAAFEYHQTRPYSRHLSSSSSSSSGSGSSSSNMVAKNNSMCSSSVLCMLIGTLLQNHGNSRGKFVTTGANCCSLRFEFCTLLTTSPQLDSLN
jgi:hypothetical protein